MSFGKLLKDTKRKKRRIITSLREPDWQILKNFMSDYLVMKDYSELSFSRTSWGILKVVRLKVFRLLD